MPISVWQLAHVPAFGCWTWTPATVAMILYLPWSKRMDDCRRRLRASPEVEAGTSSLSTQKTGQRSARAPMGQDQVWTFAERADTWLSPRAAISRENSTNGKQPATHSGILLKQLQRGCKRLLRTHRTTTMVTSTRALNNRRRRTRLPKPPQPGEGTRFSPDRRGSCAGQALRPTRLRWHYSSSIRPDVIHPCRMLKSRKSHNRCLDMLLLINRPTMSWLING